MQRDPEHPLRIFSNFTIQEICQLCDLMPHTLRIWEQRYKILEPSRTETNIRYYSINDLRKLMTVRVLQKHGFKISKIASKSNKELNELFLQLESGSEQQYATQYAALLNATLFWNEQLFNKVWDNTIARLGVEKALVEVLHPFLQQVGVFWQIGALHSGHEHFISRLIRQKIYVVSEKLSVKKITTRPRFLIYLPEGELHEHGTMLAAYLIKARGGWAINLGPGLPHSRVLQVAADFDPQHVFTVFTCFPGGGQVQEYLNRLSTDLPNALIGVSGLLCEDESLVYPKNIQYYKQPADYIAFLNQVL